MNRFPTFAILFSILLASVFSYLGVRLILPLDLSHSSKIAMWSLLAIPTLLFWGIPILYWQRDSFSSSTFGNWYARLSYGSVGFMSFLFVLTLARDLVILLALLLDRFNLLFINLRKVGSPEGAAAVIMGAFLCFGFGVYQTFKTPRVRRVQVPVEKLHQDLVGFLIAQVSDLHVSPMIRKGFVSRVVNRVNSLKPDLVALTGDFIDGTPEQLRPHVSPLGGLTAALGVFYITGNHEYYWGVDSWISEFENLQITPLLNSHRVLEKGKSRVVIAGLLDHASQYFKKGQGPDPVKALAGAPAESFKVVMAHQPGDAALNEKAGFDLQLSGHTHGGQFFPWTIVAGFVHEFFVGLERCGRMWVYVNPGTGTWGPPVRFGSPSEITLLELVPT